MSDADRRQIYAFVVVLLAIGLGVLIGSGVLQSYDVWWHLELGRDTIETGKIRLHDVYSHTAPGAYRPPQQWLFEVIQAWLYNMSGVQGMIGLRIALSILTLGLLAVLLIRRRCSYLLMAALIPVVASAGLPSISCRPHMLLPIFLLAVTAIVTISQSRRWLIWLIPPLFALWANLHASFMLGLAFLGIWAVQRTFFPDPEQPWSFRFDARGMLEAAGVFVASILACAINPVGFDLLVYPLQYLPGGELAWHSQYIDEWNRPDLSSPSKLTLLLVLVGGGVAALAGRRRLSPFEVIIVLLMIVLGIRWSRSSMQSAVIIAFIIAPLITHWLREVSAALLGYGPDSTRSPHHLLSFVLIGIAVVGVVTMHRPMQLKRIAHSDIYPDEMANYALRHDLKGHMYNPMRWGGYLIHRLHPKYRVFLDGRIDMYPQQVFIDFLHIREAKSDWEEIARRRGVEWGIVAGGERLFDAIKTNERWAMVAESDTAGLFVRVDGPNGHLVAATTPRSEPHESSGRISQSLRACFHPAPEIASPKPGGM